MCGIAGMISSQENAHVILKAMLEVQSHRGPDGQGMWRGTEHPDVYLGHRRLSILDLSEAGAQPFLDQDGSLALTYNGEIYNYLEIRKELEKRGHTFHSDCDTEVLLEAYKAWGVDCLKHFNGMFAFALYDRREQILFCARDRYGEKPFLFHRDRRRFVFSSEYKALLLHPEISLEMDEMRLIQAAYNASTGLDKDRQTVFRDLEQLLPGEAMKVHIKTLRTEIWKYWELEVGADESFRQEQEVFEEFRSLLTNAVQIRLRSDVPVGSCLSGGLDSSAIVCIVRQLLGEGKPYHTFTGRFPGTYADEWDYARVVIEEAQVESHVVEPTVERFLAELPDFMWYNELPVGGSSQFAQWCVFHLAKQNDVTVLLDGQGADEMLGGYEQYFAFYVQSLQQRGETGRLARELPRIKERYPLALTPSARSLRDRLPFRIRRFLSQTLGIGTNLLYGLHTDIAQKIQQVSERALSRQVNALTAALEQDSFQRYLTTLLRYGDRNSMAHSREVRLPFCDHRLAEFAFRLPPHLLMGEVQTKRLLREGMFGILPEKIRTRWNKQGFRPPQDLWFRSSALLTLAEDLFSDPGFIQSQYWTAPWWSHALKRVRQGQLQLGWTLLQPMMVELWKRHFLQPLKQRRASLNL